MSTEPSVFYFNSETSERKLKLFVVGSEYLYIYKSLKTLNI